LWGIGASLVIRFASLAAVLLAASAALLPAEPLLFASSYSPPYSSDDYPGILERLLAEACRRIGIEATFRNLPAERGLSDANAGFVDGVVARVEHMERMYHHLVRIRSASIESRDFVAFSRGGLSPIFSWSDLAAHNITYVRGWKIFENNATAAKSAVAVDSTRRAFELLARERTDVVLNARLDGTLMAAQLGIEDIRIHEPPLASVSLYPYVHRRNARYVLALTAALDEMKADGTFDRIYTQTVDLPNVR
jgi:polar amino acid transport system substrate-binding protein